MSVQTHRLESVRDPGHVIKAKAISGTSAITLLIFEMAKADNFSLELDFAGTVTGPVTVLMSNSYNPNMNDPQDESIALNAGHWIDVTSRYTADYTDPAGSATSGEIHGTFVEAAWLKVVITPASGSGTVDGYLSVKSL